jgi:hypothetical protein
MWKWLQLLRNSATLLNKRIFSLFLMLALDLSCVGIQFVLLRCLIHLVQGLDSTRAGI